MAWYLFARATGRGTLFRNSLAGVVATAADFALVVSLVEGLDTPPAVATFVGCILGGAVNFAVNRIWAFGSELPYVRQAARYVLVSGASALLNAGLVAALLALWPTSYRTVWIIARGAVFLGWNYPMHRYFVFPTAHRL
jgi:putative flippase GtrA